MGEPKIEIVHVSMTNEELRRLVMEAVAEALREQRAENDAGLIKHNDAAKLLGMTPTALQKRVSSGAIVPDMRGGQNGVKSHKYSRATLEAYKKDPRR